MNNYNKNTYEELIRLQTVLSENYDKKVLLNMKNVRFISANLLSVLGSVLENAINRNKHSIAFSNINDSIKRLMQMNGFNKYFFWDNIPDRYHNTIKYTIFDATTENLEFFEKFLIINVLDRADMPPMSKKVKDRIVDSFLEMFNNVIDHADSDCAYVCGQYFQNSSELVISIVDVGKTIKENVNDYLQGEIDENTLQWAIVKGNSTKTETAPGGLGFSLLLDFIWLNKGKFSLVSANECYEVTPKSKKFYNLNGSFKGTIVTITFNMNDDFAYILKEEREEEIIF